MFRSLNMMLVAAVLAVPSAGMTSVAQDGSIRAALPEPMLESRIEASRTMLESLKTVRNGGDLEAVRSELVDLLDDLRTLDRRIDLLLVDGGPEVERVVGEHRAVEDELTNALAEEWQRLSRIGELRPSIAALLRARYEYDYIPSVQREALTMARVVETDPFRYDALPGDAIVLVIGHTRSAGLMSARDAFRERVLIELSGDVREGDEIEMKTTDQRLWVEWTGGPGAYRMHREDENSIVIRVIEISEHQIVAEVEGTLILHTRGTTGPRPHPVRMFGPYTLDLRTAASTDQQTIDDA